MPKRDRFTRERSDMFRVPDPVAAIREKIEKGDNAKTVDAMISRYIKQYPTEASKTTRTRKLFAALFDLKYKNGIRLLIEKYDFSIFHRQIRKVIKIADLEGLTLLLDIGMSPDLMVKQEDTGKESSLLKLAITTKSEGYQG